MPKGRLKTQAGRDNQRPVITSAASTIQTGTICDLSNRIAKNLKSDLVYPPPDGIVAHLSTFLKRA